MPWLVESPSSPIWQGVSSEHEQIILGSFVQLVSVSLGEFAGWVVVVI